MRKLTRRLGLTTAIALVAATVAAQPASPDDTPVVSPTDVVITEFGLKYDLPLDPCLTPAIAQRLAWSTQTPMGIEALPDRCRGRRLPESEITGEIRLSGRTLGEAFDLLVRADPRYVWAESDGVIVLRPLVAWIDQDHFLHQPMVTSELDDARMTRALELVMEAMHPDRYPPDLEQFAARTPDAAHQFSTPLGSSIAVSLDAIVRAHGSLFWTVTYCQAPASLDHAMLMLYTFDESGHGTRGLGCVEGPGESALGQTP
mgnify:CR=1 FL=1